MKRRGVWPHPVLSVVLALGWLLLQQSLAVAQIVTALVLGWGLPRLVDGFLGERLVVRNWRTAAPIVLRRGFTSSPIEASSAERSRSRS